MKTYTPTIGIEVHAELKTQTKMFCSCKNEPHADEPNIHVCPICMAHPGTLPVINRQAVEHVLKVGLALKSELASFTEFDRKNYFYPDIPKGYQISQYLYPLVSGGELSSVKITRVHLEEDTARSLHDQGAGSLIDYNRAGVPLMELVTEPVIHDSKTAGNFARELQLLLRTLGVSDANMEKGEMRVEANVSVSSDSSFGTKVEVKNLNSFRSVEQAIEYEIKRQITLLEEGGVVIQETRGWDEAKGRTFSQRIKETANDYRYFPDPDLPKLDVKLTGSNILSRLSEDMPVLPQEKRIKYSDLGLSREQIETIISTTVLDTLFAEFVVLANDHSTLPRLAANYITSDLLGLLEGSTEEISVLHSDMLFCLVKLLDDGLITSRVAKDLLFDSVILGKDPRELAHERGLMQTSDTRELSAIVSLIISQNETVAADVRGGKESALQFLVGQAMKQTKGTANPGVLLSLFRKHLLDE